MLFLFNLVKVYDLIPQKVTGFTMKQLGGGGKASGSYHGTVHKICSGTIANLSTYGKHFKCNVLQEGTG